VDDEKRGQPRENWIKQVGEINEKDSSKGGTKAAAKKRRKIRSPVTFSNAVSSEPDESNTNSDDGIRRSYNRVKTQPTERVAESLPTLQRLETKEVKKKNEGGNPEAKISIELDIRETPLATPADSPLTNNNRFRKK